MRRRFPRGFAGALAAVVCLSVSLEHAAERSVLPGGEATVCAPQHEGGGARGTGENEGASKLPSMLAVVPLPLAARAACPLEPHDFPPAAANLSASEGHSRRQDRPPTDSRAS